MSKNVALNKEKFKLYSVKATITFLSLFVLISLIGNSFNVLAYGPNNPECFEQPDMDGCPSFFDAPFDRMLDPFNAVFEDFTFVIIWAIIVGILWLRVSNTMMVAVFGVVLAALFTRPDATGNLTGFSTEAQAVGWGLLILALVVAIYQILQVRVHFPTN